MTDTSPAPDATGGVGALGTVTPEATVAPEAPGAPGVPGLATTAPQPTPTAPASAGAEPSASSSARHQPRSIELLQGVEMSVTVELGRTRMVMRDLLGLRAGSVIELDRPAGSPVDVLVNGTLLARGEVVVVDDELGVRITTIAGGGLDEEM
jgi:flagellar motor switch protein FliN/FliY